MDAIRPGGGWESRSSPASWPSRAPSLCGSGDGNFMPAPTSEWERITPYLARWRELLSSPDTRRTRSEISSMFWRRPPWHDHLLALWGNTILCLHIYMTSPTLWIARRSDKHLYRKSLLYERIGLRFSKHSKHLLLSFTALSAFLHNFQRFYQIVLDLTTIGLSICVSACTVLHISHHIRPTR